MRVAEHKSVSLFVILTRTLSWQNFKFLFTACVSLVFVIFDIFPKKGSTILIFLFGAVATFGFCSNILFKNLKKVFFYKFL